MMGEKTMAVLVGLVLLVLVALTAAPPVLAAGVAPLTFFVSVVALSVFRPEWLPLWVLLPLSLVQDVAVGAPYGLHGLVAVLAMLLLLPRAKAFQRQTPVFVCALLAGSVALMQVVLCVAAGMLGEAVSVRSAMMGWLVSLPLVLLAQLVLSRWAVAK